MKQKLLIILLLLLLGAELSAQQKTDVLANQEWADSKVVITGKVINFDAHREHQTLKIRIPHLWERTKSYAPIIDEEGKFEVEIWCAYPMNFYIDYGSTDLLFCVPGDTLHLEIDANIWNNTDNETPDGQYFLQLEGVSPESKSVNRNLNLFLKNKPDSLYSDENRINAILKMPPKDYGNYIAQREKKYRTYLKEFVTANKPSNLFLKWADDYLKYESWESLLDYRWIHFDNQKEGMASIPNSYFSFLDDYKMDDSELVSFTHVGFLNQYYRYSLARPIDSARKAYSFFEEKGDIIAGARVLKRMILNNTSGFTQDLFLVKLYLDALVGKDLETFEALHVSGELKRDYFSNLIDTEHKKLIAYLNNQNTKGANLLTIENENAASLLDTILLKYHGKVVYIDFWAPWCTPCMGEMPHSKKLQKAFEDKDVVFLFLANQCTEASWKATIANENLSGEHIRLSTDQYNILSAEFGISGIPHYAIIDQNGNVISKHAPRPSDTKTKEMLQQLLN